MKLAASMQQSNENTHIKSPLQRLGGLTRQTSGPHLELEPTAPEAEEHGGKEEEGGSSKRKQVT